MRKVAGRVSAARPHKQFFQAQTEFPWIFWDLHANAVPTYDSEGLGTPTATGSPAFTNQRFTGDATAYYSYSFASGAAARSPILSLFNVDNALLLFWAQLYIDAASTNSIFFSVGNPTGTTIRWRTSKSTTWRLESHLADVDDTASTTFAGASNYLASGTLHNIAMVLDNRDASKTVAQYAAGAQQASASISALTDMDFTISGTTHMRIGASSANSPADILAASCAVRRLGIINYGASPPSNVSDLIIRLNASNGLPIPTLFLGM